MTPLARQLASNVLRSRFDDLPPDVRREASRAFLNWVGCAVGGSHHAATESALAALDEWAGRPQASVLGRGQRLDVSHATLVNGLAASAEAYDDTHLETIAHPTAPTGAALLAMAERIGAGRSGRGPVSGAELLHAVVLSNEVQCRLAAALAMPPAHCHVGHYMTGLTGAVGVAAGVGRLLGLPEGELACALGIAATQGAGLRATHASMCSGYVPARAGQCGLEAALLAAKGFTCTETLFEGRNGMLDVYGAPANPAALTERWGEHFECMAVAAKPFPAGCFIHPAIEACLTLAQTHRIEPGAIERIALRVHRLAIGLTGKTEPRVGYDAQVSVFHWAAAVFVQRAAGLAQATDACVADPAVAALRGRVEAVVDESFGPDEAEAVVTLADGRRERVHIEHCIGSRTRPMSDAELERKFVGQTEGVIGAAAAQRLVEHCRGLERAPDAALAAPGFWGPPPR